MRLFQGQPIPKDSVKIRSFKVEFKSSDVTDLKHRLANTRYVQPMLDTGFEYGFPSDELKKWIDHWRFKFDFNRTQDELNQYPQFTTQIEGIDVHYLHVKAKSPKTGRLPLVLVHGWPGSVYEYYGVIPKLSQHYELIVPSIPGYGFSEAPHRSGFTAADAGRVIVKLMSRLGHGRFAYHGGDWGAVIGRMLGVYFPQNARAIHISMMSQQINLKTLSKLVAGMVAPKMIYSSEAEAALNRGCLFRWFVSLMQETGYMHLQATKPDTIGALLIDSPAGLAAYILEKFSIWVNSEYISLPDGGLTQKFTPDQLLTNVAIYWFGGNSGHSVRLYKETIPLLFSKLKNL